MLRVAMELWRRGRSATVERQATAVSMNRVATERTVYSDPYSTRVAAIQQNSIPAVTCRIAATAAAASAQRTATNGTDTNAWNRAQCHTATPVSAGVTTDSATTIGEQTAKRHWTTAMNS